MNTRKLLVLLPVVGVLSLVVYGTRYLKPEKRNQSICQSNLKQIGLGLLQYVRDYDEKNVLADNWKKAVSPWLKNDALFKCPSDNNYALNRYLSGITITQVENSTVTPTVFDSTSTQPNASDFGASYPKNGGHSMGRRGSGTNVLFFDGHVKWMQIKPVFQAIPKNPKSKIAEKGKR